MESIDFGELLHKAGLRATAGRRALLHVLAAHKEPLTVEQIQNKLKEPLDTVTLYRALEALTEAHIISRSDFQHGHAHYELAVGRDHHHHVVCRSCGVVEDVEIPHATRPEKEAEKRVKKFSVIDAYALEFFGLCTSCA